MAIPYSRFVVTDGTTDSTSGHRNEVSLLSRKSGFFITGWNMAMTAPKEGGVWSDSSMANDRKPQVFRRGNVTETLTLEIENWTADDLSRDMMRLWELLEKAANYSPSGWSDEPVWIEAVGTNETNVRYAIVYGYQAAEAGNPFEQPFWQKILRSGISSFTLVLERESAWRGNEPGDSDCTLLSSSLETCAVYPLVFNGVSGEVDLLSPAALDNMPASGAFTVEAWIKPSGWGESNLGFIADKSNNSTIGWSFHLSNAVGLRAVVYYDVTDAISTSGTDEFGTDMFDEWHHVAMVFLGNTIDLFIDGVEVTSYPTQQAGANNPLADAATNARIGNVAAGSRTFDGEIGWTRITRLQRYAANFTPPARCVLPLYDSVSVEWLGIHEGTGATIYDLSPNNNNGTATGTTWGDCCALTYGTYDPVADELEESCGYEFAYIANKQTTAALTHIFYYDSTLVAFGANLLTGDPPYALLPAVPAATDCVYFGIQSTLVNGTPFCSLVFDLSQAQSGIANLQWEYWDGVGWSVLTVQDNTNANGAGTGSALDTTGIGSVHWEPPSDWVTVAVQAVTAYWVRAEAQDGGAQPPIQQSRHVYTITNPFVEVQEATLPGDYPALARFFAVNQSDDDTPGLRAFSNRLLMGVRSIRRGALFSPFLNLSDVESHNLSDVTASAVGTGTHADDPQAPCGRVIVVTNPAALASVCIVSMDYGDVLQYQGTFRVLLRLSQTSGGNEDLSFRFLASVSDAGLPTTSDAFYVSQEKTLLLSSTWQVIDFGQMTVKTGYGSFSPRRLTFVIDAAGNGAADAKLYDLIVFPVDEWAVDAWDKYNSTVSLIGGRNGAGALDLFAEGANTDAVSDPREWHVNKLTYGGDLGSDWQGRGAEPPQLLPHTHQRLWLLSMRYPTAGNDELRSEPRVSHSVQAWHTALYRLMRGDQ